MTMRKGLLIVAAWATLWTVILSVLLAPAAAPTAQAAGELAGVGRSLAAASLGAQVDATWFVAVPDGKTATTAPYKPSLAAADANPSLRVSMASYTGVVLRARYLTTGTLSTDPVVRVWGLKGAAWTSLADLDGNRSITLADAADDCDDGTYKWTALSAPIDALGCEAVIVTVQTAAVSAAGAVQIELTRY